MLIIPLTQGRFAKIDDEDYDRVMQYQWAVEIRSNTAYASSSLGKGKYAQRTRLHRFVLQLPNHFPQVDHVNNDGLDCQKHNLRIATTQQNSCNYKKQASISGFRGVSFQKGRYYAKIRTPDKGRQTLGGFQTPEEAAMKYDEAAIQYHGEFATLNFPDRWSTLKKVKL